MDICIRSCFTSGLVVIGVSALVAAPVSPPEPAARADSPPVALAAQVQPLPAASTLASIRPVSLLGQQVRFHIAFVGDFLSTGAALFAREFAIPGTLIRDVQNGAPTPVARALQSFVQVELDAGRELVNFAAEYVSFQLNFLRNVVRDVITAVGSTTMAFATFAAGLVSQLVTSVTASLTPATSAPAQALSASAAPADVVRTPKVNHIARSRPSAAEDGTDPSKRPKSVVAISTVHTHGTVENEISTDTTDVDAQKSTTRSKHGVVGPSTADVSEKTSPPSGGDAKRSDEPRKLHRQHDAKPTGGRGGHPKDGDSE